MNRPGRNPFVFFWLMLVLSLAAPAAQADYSIPDMVQKYGPAVVNISSTRIMHGPRGINPEQEQLFQFFRQFLPPGQMPPQMQIPGQQEFPARDSGSGFIISPDGYILTNAHVVKDSDDVVVKLTNKREYTAKVVGSDPVSDIALLKIRASDLPVVTLGNPDKLRVGDQVVAIGSPFGFENSVTSGIVSAMKRSLPDESYVPFIQTDVPINPGNSGGPLFNMQGQVVGINSQIYTRSGGYQGLSFAIPINVAMYVADQIKTGHKIARGWLGVSIQEVTGELADSFGLPQPEGALVATVEKSSPAERAGMLPSDVILKFDGKAVHSSSDLPLMVSMTKPGTDVPVEVWRKGQMKTLNVKLGTLPVHMTEASAGLQKQSHLRGGLVLGELSPAQRKELKLDHGLLVEDSSGDALLAGIRVGDVILAVNNSEVGTVAQFRHAIDAVPVGKSVALLVRRGNSTVYVPMKLSTAAK